MKILVTGASGHLGYHICKSLLDEGYRVRAFVRPSSYREHLLKLSVDVCFGDILEKESLKNALNGVDVIFHSAAIYTLSETKDSGQNLKDNLIVKTATEGTKHLYSVAREYAIKKIIYTSSVETVGLSYDKSRLLDESHSAKDAFYVYSVAKIEAEKIALAFSREYRLPTMVCNPSTIIGKDDYKPTPSNTMLLNFIKFHRFYVEGGQSLVDVKDVALGHLHALKRGQNGHRYILSGENIEIRDLILLIKEIVNMRGPMIKLNKLFLYPAAGVFEIFSNITGKEPFLTRRKVLRSVGSYSYYDCSKARKELGYVPKNLTDTLPSTLKWLKSRYI